MRRSRKALKRISVGVGRRTVGVMKVAAKTGVAALRNGESEGSDARWDHISEELGRMKGLMMKMGQMQSVRVRPRTTASVRMPRPRLRRQLRRPK